ncbi:hypothetical protein ACFWPV_16550 [Streptomyces uncialis]|uniref:hypothetical protein n=1 Tax=Streptomyces uncialis TaxID=1048205 RepID=UPI003664AA69
MEKVRLGNACQEITGAEAAVREAWDRLHQQILHSGDASLYPDRIVRAVDGRTDADAAESMPTRPIGSRPRRPGLPSVAQFGRVHLAALITHLPILVALLAPQRRSRVSSEARRDC